MKTHQKSAVRFSLTCSLLLMLQLSGCANVAPSSVRTAGMALATCPTSPNCVNSETDSADAHYVKPIVLGQHGDADWENLRALALEIKRSKLLAESEGYLHLQVSSFSRLFRDDLELRLLSERGLVHIRSASRIGYSDFGVNRKRVEALRRALLEGQTTE